MKAMLLAAGLGTRMGALTRDCPKPLLTVAGKPLIVHHLERLVAAGISEIVINLHYLPDQIMALLGDGRAYAANIRCSYEPLLLGTAGGICQALPLLGDDPFLVISSDIYTDFPWTDFLENTFKLADDKDAYIILINNY